MIQYTIRTSSPNKHFIDIELQTETQGAETMRFQLPSWRPGRYELANYAQNVQRWKAFDAATDMPLHAKKVTKDLWEVQTAGVSQIVIRYNYFAYQLDAGASYFDEHQLYVNPVNCLLYIPERVNDPCRLRLEIPNNYQIACGLDFKGGHAAEAENYHQLADSPFIASAELHHHQFDVNGYTFHIWMKGTVNPDWERILKDFERFCAAQVEMFGELPVKQYHFLYQLPNVKFYHGVEHLDSTVICLGPGYRLMEKDIYNEFLGISSHELFHSWNIKAIRPVEMYPYDYSRENYSNLGYVAEGVTTYYGDLMLLRSGVFNFETFAVETCKFVQRHFHNYGRHFQSLAESSFDTWLDGYKPGVPDRKVSMYVKGMMVAFLMDIRMRQESGNEANLDQVLVTLYNDYAKKGRGYSEQDYLELVSKIAGQDYQEFFEKFVWGLEPLEGHIHAAFHYVGCDLVARPSFDLFERIYGFKIKEDSPKCIVSQLAPGSPADHSMLSLNDEIIAVNGLQVDNNSIDNIFNLNEGQDYIDLALFRSKTLIHTRLHAVKEHNFFPTYHLVKQKEATAQQKENFRLWTGREF